MGQAAVERASGPAGHPQARAGWDGTGWWAAWSATAGCRRSPPPPASPCWPPWWAGWAAQPAGRPWPLPAPARSPPSSSTGAGCGARARGLGPVQGGALRRHRPGRHGPGQPGQPPGRAGHRRTAPPGPSPEVGAPALAGARPAMGRGTGPG